MDFNRLTLKSQEAVAGAQELARRAGNAELTPDHLTIALLDQELVRTLVERSAEAPASLRAEAEARLAALPTVSGGSAQPQVSARFSRVLDRALDEAQALGDEYISVEHLLLALEVVPRDRAAACAAGRPRRPARDVPGPRGLVPGTGEVRPRPHLARREREARSGDRPRRGDQAGHPGSLPANEEQSGPDRRAGRRQDGDRRGARAAHRRGRCARGPEGQARVGARPRCVARRRQVPRRVRGAAQGRARGDPERRGRDRPLHRRAAHDRRRGRRGGSRRRREPPEADARAR